MFKNSLVITTGNCNFIKQTDPHTIQLIKMNMGYLAVIHKKVNNKIVYAHIMYSTHRNIQASLLNRAVLFAYIIQDINALLE